MNTTITTRFAGFMVAVLMTVAVQGAMLWTFDNTAQDVLLAKNSPAVRLVTLETVTITAHHS
jgi:hypothetical protein